VPEPEYMSENALKSDGHLFILMKVEFCLEREGGTVSESVGSMAEKAALSPGTLVYVGEAREEAAHITVIIYDRDTCAEQTVEPEELEALKELPGTKWISVAGIHDVETVKRVGQIFGLHALVLEDVVNTEQRPKVEDFSTYLFIVLKNLGFNRETLSIEEHHISILLGDGFVLSFLEGADDPFAPARQRILAGKRRIRRMGADYLAYALVDVVVDSYFRVIEDFEDLLEAAEEKIFTEPNEEILHLLHKLKRASLQFRKAVSPLREATGYLIREDSDLLAESTAPFLRDVQDHLTHTMEAARAHEETLDSLVELYLNSQSHRLNQVMKFLTIVATVFIPLTFIAGVYGMNFKNMPELGWSWGYPIALGVMATIAVSMLLLLRRKKWL
jgi:magnesium transporter